LKVNLATKLQTWIETMGDEIKLLVKTIDRRQGIVLVKLETKK